MTVGLFTMTEAPGMSGRRVTQFVIKLKYRFFDHTPIAVNTSWLLDARLCAKKPSSTTGDFGRRVILIFWGLIETWLVDKANEQLRGISLLTY